MDSVDTENTPDIQSALLSGWLAGRADILHEDFMGVLLNHLASNVTTVEEIETKARELMLRQKEREGYWKAIQGKGWWE